MIGGSRSGVTGIIVLPAGKPVGSGPPKPSALFRNDRLLRHAAETALRAGLGPVNVVVSPADPHSLDLLTGLDVSILQHPVRNSSQCGAIATGIRPWLGRRGRPDGVILLRADQAEVTPAHLQALVEVAAPRFHSIVATAFGNQLGAPAWFAPDKFFRLLLLEGKEGIKSLIAREPRLHRLELSPAAVGMDLAFKGPPKLSAAFGNDRPRPRAA